MNRVDGDTIRCIDPRTGETTGEIPTTPLEQIGGEVAKARAAQRDWREAGLGARKTAIRALHKAFLANAEKIADLLAQECGRPAGEAWTAEIVANHELFGFWLGAIDDLLTATPIQLNPINYPGKRGVVRLEPLGVLGLITPWNLPVAIPLRGIVPALLAGNTIAWKPSGVVPRTSAFVHALMVETLPPDVVVLIQGGGAHGAALIGAGIHRVFFTGSVATGKKVAHAATNAGIQTSMELGGKDAALVLPDADLDRAAAGITWAAFAFAGQNCAAIERCFVHVDVAEALIERIVERTSRLRPFVDVGPLVTETQLNMVRDHLAQAIQAGARVLTGGAAPGPGYFHEPTVLTDVTDDMAIMREESFGPLLPITTFEDLGEAIDRVNNTDFGLTTSIWTKDLELGESLADNLDCGVVTVNNHSFTGALASAAWGGVKDSGHGVTNSRFALYEMTRPRTILIDRSKAPEMWWYPYNSALQDVTRGVITLAGTGSPKLGALLKVLTGLKNRWKEDT